MNFDPDAGYLVRAVQDAWTGWQLHANEPSAVNAVPIWELESGGWEPIDGVAEFLMELPTGTRLYHLPQGTPELAQRAATANPPTALDGVRIDVLTQAYGWSIDIDGELHGLVAGDMGYEPTGLRLEGTELANWKMGLAMFVAQRAARTARDIAIARATVDSCIELANKGGIADDVRVAIDGLNLTSVIAAVPPSGPDDLPRDPAFSAFPTKERDLTVAHAARDACLACTSAGGIADDVQRSLRRIDLPSLLASVRLPYPTAIANDLQENADKVADAIRSLQAPAIPGYGETASHLLRQGFHLARLAAADLVARRQSGCIDGRPIAALETALSRRLHMLCGIEPLAATVTLDRNDVLHAAGEIERYYGGQTAWKRTAEQKDRDFADFVEASRKRLRRKRKTNQGKTA
jgi:hypothetical protein